MKIHDFAANFLFENQTTSISSRNPRDAPRASRGAQWRVLSGSKTRHLIHVYIFLHSRVPKIPNGEDKIGKFSASCSAIRHSLEHVRKPEKVSSQSAIIVTKKNRVPSHRNFAISEMLDKLPRFSQIMDPSGRYSSDYARFAGLEDEEDGVDDDWQARRRGSKRSSSTFEGPYLISAKF